MDNDFFPLRLEMEIYITDINSLVEITHIGMSLLGQIHA